MVGGSEEISELGVFLSEGKLSKFYGLLLDLENLSLGQEKLLLTLNRFSGDYKELVVCMEGSLIIRKKLLVLLIDLEDLLKADMNLVFFLDSENFFDILEFLLILQENLIVICVNLILGLND
jgi:hypothetical protein